MTAVLQLLQDIARHLEVKTTVTPERLRDLMKKTDIQRLTMKSDELVEPTTGTATSERPSATGDSNGDKASGASKKAVTASSEA
jgi:hypothetical protein